jgi:hypothetical protein
MRLNYKFISAGTEVRHSGRRKTDLQKLYRIFNRLSLFYAADFLMTRLQGKNFVV